MGLRLESPLVLSINMRGGTRGDLLAYTPPHMKPYPPPPLSLNLEP
jgi:hypothetical protein